MCEVEKSKNMSTNRCIMAINVKEVFTWMDALHLDSRYESHITQVGWSMSPREEKKGNRFNK